MPGYEWDVFISYRRDSRAGDWVNNHFAHLLELCLADSMEDDPRVFVDTEDIGPGDAWSPRLRTALHRSKVLVPVLAPPYFRSRWCVAELASMRAREDHCGLRSVDNPSTLIAPIGYFDGEHFPAWACEYQETDFREFNYDPPQFRETLAFLDFGRQVERFATALAAKLPAAPLWDADFPFVEPEVPDLAQPNLPRL